MEWTKEQKNRFAEVMEELMNKFNEHRAKWIAVNGNDNGFGDWFFNQVPGLKIRQWQPPLTSLWR